MKNVDFIKDNDGFQKKYGFDSADKNYDYLKFRIESLLTEEFNETINAYKGKDSEELVDGLIDMLVIIFGTLSLFDIDINKAWNEVYRANMSKVRGVKPGREESGGVDVYKPEGWTGPDHSDNHGKFDEAFNSNN